MAIRLDQLIRDGVVADQAELARLGHVSRARLTQIMNLLYLAPDLQEKLLFWPTFERGRIASTIAFRLPVQSVAFTAHEPKVATLIRNEIELHYDDAPAEEASAAGTGIHVVLLNGVTFHV